MLIRGTEYAVEVIACCDDELKTVGIFDDFEQVNACIEQIAAAEGASDSISLNDSDLLIAMSPKDGGAAHVCDCYAGDWAPLDQNDIDAIVSEMGDYAELQHLIVDGQGCLLRLYVENSSSKLLFKKDFVSIVEFEQFVADNPNLDDVVCAEGAGNDGWLIPIVGIAEVINGEAKRRPEVLSFDDGMGIPWYRECVFGVCNELLHFYKQSCSRRDYYCLQLLADHDVKALTEGEERSSSQMIYQIVRNLVKRGYDVVSARSDGLLGEWGEEGDPVPTALEMEIIFDDDYRFPIPIPAGIPYSEAYGKITFAGGLVIDEEEGLPELIKERFKSNFNGISVDELGAAALPFIEDVMEEIALERLLEWSEALPIRA